MRIEHIALWTEDIERLKEFYVKYFGAVSNELYENKKKGFKSYFLSFKEGARLEIMSRDDIKGQSDDTKERIGYCHFSVTVDTMFQVMKLTDELRSDGYEVIGEPRVTGDGYCESVVLDPDGNRVEIMKDPYINISHVNGII